MFSSFSFLAVSRFFVCRCGEEKCRKRWRRIFFTTEKSLRKKKQKNQKRMLIEDAFEPPQELASAPRDALQVRRTRLGNELVSNDPGQERERERES